MAYKPAIPLGTGRAKLAKGQKMIDLTYEEKLLLTRLKEGPRPDRDGIPERVLVNTGLARRIDVGQIEITDGGAQVCTYPACKCVVSTSTSQPKPTCPKRLS